MNDLVIDIKSTCWNITFSSQHVLPSSVGVLRDRTQKDLPGFWADLKSRRIYPIVRLAEFKDGSLALGCRVLTRSENPELALPAL